MPLHARVVCACPGVSGLVGSLWSHPTLRPMLASRRWPRLRFITTRKRQGDNPRIGRGQSADLPSSLYLGASTPLWHKTRAP